MITLASCESCHFYSKDARPDYSEKSGYCRRFPPQIVAEVGRDGWGNQISHIEQHSPYVNTSDWCGEWFSKQSIEDSPDA